MTISEIKAYNKGYNAALRESWNATYDAAKDFITSCINAGVDRRGAINVLNQEWDELDNDYNEARRDRALFKNDDNLFY